MEKISGILPSSARITSVDLKSSGAVRSGTPNYGRPVGLNSVTERENLAATRAQSAHVNLMKNRSLDPQSKIVHDMAENFFNKKNDIKVDSGISAYMNANADSDLNPLTSEKPMTQVDWSMPKVEMVEATSGVDNEVKIVAQGVLESAEAREAEDLDRPEVGGYLDVQA